MKLGFAKKGGASATPSGAAGGGLTGTYPNPTLVAASPTNSVQFNSSGAFAGNANLEFFPTALSTPAAPTVVTQGTAGVTSYGYKIAACSVVGCTVLSAETTIATGNATLNGTNFNRITIPASVNGCTYIVSRSSSAGTPSDTGIIGVAISGGTTFDDTGLTVVGSNFAHSTANYSQGEYLGYRFRQPSLGDTDFWAYIGTDIDAISATGPGLFLPGGAWNWAYRGSSANIYSGLLNLVFTDTSGDNPPIGFQITTSSESAIVGGLTVAVEAQSGYSGSGTTTGRFGVFQAHPKAWSGNTPLVIGYDVTDLTGGGTADAVYGIRIQDIAGATTSNVGIYSEVSAGSGKYAFYGAGTAASHFGGAIDVTGGITTTPVAVAALPASPVEGMRAAVNNSNAVSFTAGIGSVVAGGGTTHVPVYYDGTNWRIG